MTHYNFFNDEIGKALKERTGPWFVVPITTRLWNMDYDEPGMTLAGCEIAYWILENAPDEQIVVESNNGRNGWLFFTKEQVAETFKEWHDSMDFEFNKLNKHRLWPGKEDFDNDLAENGSIKIANSFEFSIQGYKPDGGRNFFITKTAFNIFVWTKKNMKGKIWHWRDKFYFELNEDALAFKLAHVEEEKGRK